MGPSVHITNRPLVTDGAPRAWRKRPTTAAAPGAVRATKELLRTLRAQAWLDGLTAAAATSAELFAGAEAAEGMDAFLQKRRPEWDTTA